MDFAFSEDARALGTLTREICARIVTDERQRLLDRRFGPGHGDSGDATTDRVDDRLVLALADAGVTAALTEAAHAARRGESDPGVGMEGLAAVLRELGRATTDPTPWLVAGVTGTAGLSPVVGPDGPSGPGCAVAADGTVTGSGTLVPGAPGATAFLVATDDGGLRRVDAAQARVDREIPTDHRHLGSVGFDSAPGTAAAGTASGLRCRLALALCAHQWGVLERGLEAASGYAGEREQFGRPIGAFQAVRQRLASGFIDVDAVRLSLVQALHACGTAEEAPTGDPGAAEGALATAVFWACEAGHRVAHTVIHVHGGVGLDRDHHVHRYFTAASTTIAMLGGSTRALLRSPLGRP